ncbi:MAG: argininosuccinate synthase [Candidatus Margulisiibacteriota bacterium]
MSIKKVVLAYSGGLDTSVCIPWIKDKYGCEIIAFAADLGQGEDFEALKAKALKSGASEIIVEDLKDTFIKDFIYPALKANALYENKYLLATALGRPLIAEKMAAVALAKGADALAHGCTGKGNDQVRFDLTFMAKAPGLKIIAPVREWEFKSREEEIDYAMAKNIPVVASKAKPFSIDINLWGCAIECGILEDPWEKPPAEIYSMTTLPQEAPDQTESVEITFEQGLPVAVNGEKLSRVDLIAKLNTIAGKHGIGLVDLIEDRLVGIKSREVYECPGGTVLYLAHRELENMVLDRDTIALKDTLSQTYSRLIYNGQWFSPLRSHLDAFMNATQAYVSGTIRLELYKGNCTPVGRKSDYSLYNKHLATYDKEDTFNHGDGEAFCRLWGLPQKVASQVQHHG